MYSRTAARFILLPILGIGLFALPLLGRLAEWEGEPLGPLFDPLTMYGPPLTVSGTTQIKAGKLIVDAFGSTNGVTVEDSALAVQAGDAVLGGDLFVGGDAGFSVLTAYQAVNIGLQSASTASQSLTVSGTAAFTTIGGTPTITIVNEDAASTPALAGSTESNDNPAVAGVSASTLGGGGIRGQGGTTTAETQSSIGVLGTAANGQGTSWAGYFQGRVGIDLRDVDVTTVPALQVGWGRIANLNADMLDGLDAEDFVPALGDLGGTFLDLQAAPATTQTSFPFAISGLLRADGGLAVSDATDATYAVCQERYGQAAVVCGGTTDGTAAGAYGTGGNAVVGATTYGIYADAQPANTLAAQFTGPVRFAGHDGPGSFVQGPDLPFGQYGQTATTLPGGDVFIAGGIDATAPAHYLAKTRQYDGSAFVTGPTMATARAEHTATLTQHWWDTDYAYRQRITVSAPQVVPVGYTVATTVDTDALIAAGQLQADRDDWRILYWTGATWTELDRDVVSPTLTRFALKASIASGGSDSNYYVTYGNPDATDPPDNSANVYFFYDDFSTDTTVQYTWEETCSSPTAPVSAVGHTYRSVGGESYVDITTAETCSVTARRQWSTSLTGAVVEYAFRPYATWPTDGTASVVLSNAGDASTNAYRFSRPHATHGPGDFNIELEKRVGSTPVIANSNDAFAPYALDDWHTVAMTITPSQVDAVFDGSTASSGTDGTSTALTFNTVALTFSQQDQHLDTIRVRPYVNPEPTTTATSETYGVLLAGGTNGAVLGSTEVYYPDGRIVAGPAITPRRAHTATLLADGRVLIAGGYAADGSVLASSELYTPDPSGITGGTVTAGPAMTAPRAEHTATLLPTGFVLVAGGSNGTQGLTTTEYYLGPPVNIFVNAGMVLSARRADHAATLLLDGRVLLSGGRTDGAGTNVASTDLYANAVIAAGPAMGAARSQHTATLLRDGNVLVVGGDSGGAAPGVELFHTTGNVFVTAPALSLAGSSHLQETRREHAASATDDGGILVVGGIRTDGTLSNVTMRYEPTVAPLSVSSATVVAGLDADLLDGRESSDFVLASLDLNAAYVRLYGSDAQTAQTTADISLAGSAQTGVEFLAKASGNGRAAVAASGDGGQQAVYGRGNSINSHGTGVYGRSGNGSGTNWAGYFLGRTDIAGNLTIESGDLLVDQASSKPTGTGTIPTDAASVTVANSFVASDSLVVVTATSGNGTSSTFTLRVSATVDGSFTVTTAPSAHPSPITFDYLVIPKES